MTRFLQRLALPATMICVLAACGGGPAATSPGAAPTAASGPASALPVASTSGQAPATVAPAPAASGMVLPPIFSSHADAALESQLPTQVSGTAMTHYSIGFAELLADSTDRASIDAFLQGMGKSEADGSFAAALDPTNTLGGGIFAFKVNGADAALLLGGIVEVEKSDLGAGATTTQATVGGKNVTVLSIGSGVNDTEWIYGRGDVVFVVHAADEAHAAAFLQAIQ